jgi:hypothetical protein
MGGRPPTLVNPHGREPLAQRYSRGIAKVVESQVPVSIPYSPSRRRQWVGVAVAALLFAPLFWKPKPLMPAIAPLPAASGESAHSFEEVTRTTPSTRLVAAAPAADAAPSPAHDPE